MYPSPFLEILDLNDTSNIEIEDEDIIYPMNIGLRRITNKNYCRMCKHIFYYDYLHLGIDRGKIICCFCSNEIIRRTIYRRLELKSKKYIRKIMLKILDDIREFGMRPDRIFQTLLFEYNWKR